MTAYETPWQDNCPSITSRLKWILNKNLHTDVQFTVGSVEKAMFSAHKIILASGSPVFETMFYGSCPEVTDPINVPDIEPTGFSFMLKYLYENHREFRNEKEVFYTLTASKKYMIKDLEQLCYDNTEQMILTAENVWTILECSHYLNLEDSIEKCLLFIENNAKQSFQSSEFFTTSEHIIKMVLDRPLLRIKEAELLDFIAEWAEKHSYSFGFYKQEVIQQFLPYIDILSIDKNDFTHLIEKHKNIFNNEDKVNFLLNFLKPEQKIVPAWCCTEGPRCKLTENLSNFLDEKNVQKNVYTSVISMFECQYKLSFDKTIYRDVQKIVLKWCNKPQDLPLTCDIILSWGKDLNQTINNVEKTSPMEEINIDLQRNLATTSSNTCTVKVKVQFKYPIRVCFLNSTKPKKLSVNCEFQRSFGMTQWKRKIIFSKASCISRIEMIRWKKLKS